MICPLSAIGLPCPPSHTIADYHPITSIGLTPGAHILILDVDSPARSAVVPPLSTMFPDQPPPSLDTLLVKFRDTAALAKDGWADPAVGLRDVATLRDIAFIAGRGTPRAPALPPWLAAAFAEHVTLHVARPVPLDAAAPPLDVTVLARQPRLVLLSLMQATAAVGDGIDFYPREEADVAAQTAADPDAADCVATATMYGARRGVSCGTSTLRNAQLAALVKAATDKQPVPAAARATFDEAVKSSSRAEAAVTSVPEYARGAAVAAAGQAAAAAAAAGCVCAAWMDKEMKQPFAKPFSRLRALHIDGALPVVPAPPSDGTVVFAVPSIVAALPFLKNLRLSYTPAALDQIMLPVGKVIESLPVARRAVATLAIRAAAAAAAVGEAQRTARPQPGRPLPYELPDVVTGARFRVIVRVVEGSSGADVAAAAYRCVLPQALVCLLATENAAGRRGAPRAVTAADVDAVMKAFSREDVGTSDGDVEGVLKSVGLSGAGVVEK